MAENSKIEWTTHTANLWHGCVKVSPLCDNCYADALDRRYGPSHFGIDADRRFIKSVWSDVPKWNAASDPNNPALIWNFSRETSAKGGTSGGTRRTRTEVRQHKSACAVKHSHGIIPELWQKANRDRKTLTRSRSG